MALALPPSSIVTGFMCLPAKDARIAPTGELPVKLIFFMCGLAISASVTGPASAGLWCSKLMQPSGKPASRKISYMAQ